MVLSCVTLTLPNTTLGISYIYRCGVSSTILVHSAIVRHIDFNLTLLSGSMFIRQVDQRLVQ